MKDDLVLSKEFQVWKVGGQKTVVNEDEAAVKLCN